MSDHYTATGFGTFICAGRCRFAPPLDCLHFPAVTPPQGEDDEIARGTPCSPSMTTCTRPVRGSSRRGNRQTLSSRLHREQEAAPDGRDAHGADHSLRPSLGSHLRGLEPKLWGSHQAGRAGDVRITPTSSTRGK